MRKLLAILVTENDEVYMEEFPSEKLINSAGSGDSMVSGFIY